MSPDAFHIELRDRRHEHPEQSIRFLGRFASGEPAQVLVVGRVRRMVQARQAEISVTLEPDQLDELITYLHLLRHGAATTEEARSA